MRYDSAFGEQPDFADGALISGIGRKSESYFFTGFQGPATGEFVVGGVDFCVRCELVFQAADNQGVVRRHVADNAGLLEVCRVVLR